MGVMSDEEIANVDTRQLCGFHGWPGAKKRIRRELMRRGVFNADEWRIIDKKRIAIGASDLLLLASWGYPDDMNASVTARNVSKQWVYGSHTSASREVTYVYTRNGKISSMQYRTKQQDAGAKLSPSLPLFSKKRRDSARGRLFSRASRFEGRATTKHRSFLLFHRDAIDMVSPARRGIWTNPTVGRDSPPFGELNPRQLRRFLL